MEENFRQYLNVSSDFPHIYIGKRILSIDVASSQLTEHFKDKNNPTLSKIFSQFLNEYGFNHSEVVQIFVLPWYVTIDSKLRVCHYKIVNGLVPNFPPMSG